ncbi:MAG: hypothetical protein UY61_C0018G0009 [Candidatus Adlerbacteria bacterium GW2011_GWC1_50_9]|uniref:Uncharacterized protein n=1 Tax=Candidatus Adlerbacteria bacterium GW2011_GWC1_50_9 TaxID=1618608 RepID=A0A0G1WQ36_9BACT|nr:MAG: hypothetical protein UY61_C0018G0009 [Candidatus Adlerbacteria bacterium GW2011_GWC1_50_9]
MTKSLPSRPISLTQAVELLADNNTLNRILREGNYRAVGNRIATFIAEMQNFRKVDLLDGDDMHEVKQGIQRVVNMPACRGTEKPHLLETIEECLRKRQLSLEYVEGIALPEHKE